MEALKNLMEALKNLIEAHNYVEAVKLQLDVADDQLADANKKFTDIVFDDVYPSISVDETIVVGLNGKHHLVTIDVDGDHAHKVEKIDKFIDVSD